MHRLVNDYLSQAAYAVPGPTDSSGEQERDHDEPKQVGQ
jgi:hypothetical protein